MDPRISFSNDFVDAQQVAAMNNMKREGIYREAPVSSDFEFCVNNYAMISADEVFSQGMLVPNSKTKTTTTLRDELLVRDDLYDDVLPRIPKSLSRWKERLGLRKKDKKIISNSSSINDHGFLPRVAEQEEKPTNNEDYNNLGLFHGGGQNMC